MAKKQDNRAGKHSVKFGFYQIQDMALACRFVDGALVMCELLQGLYDMSGVDAVDIAVLTKNKMRGKLLGAEGYIRKEGTPKGKPIELEDFMEFRVFNYCPYCGKTIHRMAHQSPEAIKRRN